MTTKIIATIAGFFVYDKEGSLTDFKAYNKDPENIASKIHNLSKYTISEELEAIIPNISDEVIESNSIDVVNFIRSSGRKSDLLLKTDFYQDLMPKISALLIEKGFITNESEFRVLTKDVSILVSKKSVAYSSQRIDKNVAHAILSMDDIDKTTNLFSSRIREWYGVHFPEILKEVENHVTLCKLITEVGPRDKFTEDKLKGYGFSNEHSSKIANLATKSMGASFEEKDLRPLREMAQRNLDLYTERDKLESWIEKEMGRIAPNMKAVVGSSIAARMIAIVGGLMELAMKPASTIQLLGAEKALFRALKTGAKPPKHGIIYQMPELHGCSWWQRGNVARAIAGRLTIAARVDAFQGHFVGDQLKNEVDMKIAEIKEKYKLPPEGKKPPEERPEFQRQRSPQRKGQRPPQRRGQRPPQRKGYRPPQKKGKQQYNRRR